VPAPFKTTVCGIEELHDHSAVGVTHVLSILDPGRPLPDAFGSFREHERLEPWFNDRSALVSTVNDFDGMPRRVSDALAAGRCAMNPSV
jgi:hypothetical protein